MGLFTVRTRVRSMGVPTTTASASVASIVAASAFVKAGVEIPPRVLVAGMPAKVIRPLSDEEIRWKSEGTATYQDLSRRSLATMQETTPLAAVEPGRKRIHMPDVVPLVELRRKEG